MSVSSFIDTISILILYLAGVPLTKLGIESTEVLTIRDEDKPKVGRNGGIGGGDAHAIDSDHPTS